MNNLGAKPAFGQQRSDSISSSLLEKVQSADPDAWHRLVAVFGPLVYSWARKAGFQPQDAQDIVSEVFSDVLSGVGRFRRQSANDTFRGWLWTITRRRILKAWQQKQKSPQAFGGTTAHRRLGSIVAEPRKPNCDEQHEQLCRVQWRTAASLRKLFDPTHWNAFWRVVVEGDLPANVADDLGVSVWVVYKAKSRVLNRLRQELQGI